MSLHCKGATASWDFGSCIELLRQGIQHHDLEASPQPNNNDRLQNIHTGGLETDIKIPSLGNFDAIFKHLGTEPIEIPQRYSSSSDEASANAESYSTAASSPPDDIPEDFGGFTPRKAVRWHEDVRESQSSLWSQPWDSAAGRPELKDIQLKQMQQPSESPESVLRAKRHTSTIQTLPTIFQPSGFADPLPLTPVRKSKNQHIKPKRTPPLHCIHPSAKNLTPAWVTPPAFKNITLTSPYGGFPIDIPQILLDPAIIRPIFHATRDSKQLIIAEKLLRKFGTTSASIEDDLIRAINQPGGNESVDGIHVFVDSSNITIGFRDALRKARGINKNAYTKFPPLSYHSLALIMERGRGVAKRVLVGSSRKNVRPDYMMDAASCGYEVSTLELVEKFKEVRGSDIEIHRRLTGTGCNMSSGSGSEAPLNTFKTVTEQGVDEILHMKMLESIVDTKDPSIMVLATGDAAVAEYSSGFLKNVERALEKGWKVELITWKDSMSFAYRNKAFTSKWKGKFVVVELDGFQEELLDVYTNSPDSPAKQIR